LPGIGILDFGKTLHITTAKWLKAKMRGLVSGIIELNLLKGRHTMLCRSGVIVWKMTHKFEERRKLTSSDASESLYFFDIEVN
jgi:hypothetical protein